MAIVSWNAAAFSASLAAGVERGMNLALAELDAEVRRLVSVAGGGRPSAPGDPPALQAGRLAANIDFEVDSEGDRIHGLVGVYDNVAYAMRLELGFAGVDSLGRHYLQAPRPFLRPALLANFGRVVETVAAQARR